MAQIKRRGRPRSEDSPAGLADILTAALQVFAENGFEGTSVAALNRRLGVSHNMIHQRFGSKEGLWYAAVDFAFGQIAEEIDVDADMVEKDLASAMRGVIVEFLEVHARHPEILRLVTVEGATAGPRLDYLFDAHVRPLYARLTNPLKPLIDQGVLSPIDVRSVHFLLAHGGTAPFSLAPFARMLDPIDPCEQAAITHHAEFVADIIVTGIAARLPRAEDRSA
jgi:TetR/AcrR family transcriptional regulator